MVPANIVVCPKCETEFVNSRINGLALVEFAQSVESHKRMHCRMTLDTLEREFKSDPRWPVLKKAVLDGYNDLARDVHNLIGFGKDVE